MGEREGRTWQCILREGEWRGVEEVKCSILVGMNWSMIVVAVGL